jgi:hypothetical protein
VCGCMHWLTPVHGPTCWGAYGLPKGSADGLPKGSADGLPGATMLLVQGVQDAAAGAHMRLAVPSQSVVCLECCCGLQTIGCSSDCFGAMHAW